MKAQDTGHSYWAGMTTRLKIRLLVWTIYWTLALWLIYLGSLTGVLMVIAAVFWMLAKVWILNSFLELDRHDSKGLLDYTLGHIWTKSVYVRSFFMSATVVAALAALGWFGTEDLRIEASAPTLSERISDNAGSLAIGTFEKVSNAAEATKDTTKWWIATAKGWFASDDPEAVE